MKKAILLTAALSSAATLAVSNLPSLERLQNAKVRITEVTYPPNVARERYIRQTDQMIVFLDDCRYQRKDPATGETTVRERKAGDVIWHDKGEDAPQSD